MRRAAKTDSTQAPIVEALRKIGAKVYYIKEPVDLVVGFRKRNILMEVKDVNGTLTKGQEEFIATWPGEVHIVRSIGEALTAVLGKKAMS